MNLLLLMYRTSLKSDRGVYEVLRRVVPSGITLSFAFSGNLSAIVITLHENRYVKLVVRGDPEFSLYVTFGV